MRDQNSDLNNSIRPEALQSELSIGRDTYYSDLKHLEIKADKDDEGKAYLTFEQAEQVRALRSYVIEKGTRKGFVYEKVEHETNIRSSIVKAGESTIETSDNNAQGQIEIAEQEIYLAEPETNPTKDVDFDRIFNAAEELAAKKIAIADLLTVELAENMTYEDLPPELQEKIKIANEAATGKKFLQVKNIAQDLLKQRRMQRAS